MAIGYKIGDLVVWSQDIVSNTHIGLHLQGHFGHGPFAVLRVERVPLACIYADDESKRITHGHGSGPICLLCIERRRRITGHLQQLYIRADQDFPITAAYFMHAPEPRKENSA